MISKKNIISHNMVYFPSLLELLKCSTHAYNIMRVICLLVSRICSMLLQDSLKKKKITGLIRPTYTYHLFIRSSQNFRFNESMEYLWGRVISEIGILGNGLQGYT